MEKELQDLFDIINYPEENCAGFMSLCDKAKALIFDAIIYLFDDDNRTYFIELVNMCDLFDYNMTPVEQIFWVAYCIYLVRLDKYQNINYFNKLNIPIKYVLFEETKPQYDLFFDGKNFKPDFIIDFSRKNIKGEYIYPELKKLKYVVEIDGFEYHSKKSQMNYDYQRENLLKLNGYNVIRYTGSQIYREPYNCVHNFISIVFNDINKIIKE